MNGRFLFLTAGVMLACGAVANDEESVSEARKANIARCGARLAENMKNFDDAGRSFVARGVIADKKARTVKLDCFTTGVGPGDVAEFFMITENSGHGYEALLATFAKADDLCKAIEFIGVPRGRGVNYDKMTFWPKGERLMGTAAITSAPPVALASLVADAETKIPLAETGFIYTGDRRDETGAFIGDASGPGSVISSYNEPVTVLDIPRMAVQAEVYEKFTVSQHAATNADLWVEVTLVPETRPADSPRRVMDVTVAFSTNGVALDGAAAGSFKDALQKLQAYSVSQRDVYATPVWSDDLPLAQIRDFCRVLKLVDIDDGIRVETPMSGDPYYKAFVPQEEWRDRVKRFTQPCELRLGADGAATLVAITEVWKDDALKPELKIEEIPGVTVETLPRLLKEKGPDVPVLLVFAPGTLKYGDIKPYLKAALGTHQNLYIFVD